VKLRPGVEAVDGRPVQERDVVRQETAGQSRPGGPLAEEDPAVDRQVVMEVAVPRVDDRTVDQGEGAPFGP